MECRVIDNLDYLKKNCDVVLANRLHENLNDIYFKVVSRDILETIKFTYWKMLNICVINIYIDIIFIWKISDLLCFWLFLLFRFSQEVDITELDLANVDLSLIEDANIDDGLVDEGIGEDRQESLQGTTSLIESRKFGFNFINTSPTNISATTDLPVPSTYISLNDELRIILSGNKRNTYNLRVNLDGSILFPGIGSVFVVGESFEEVKSKLRNLVNNTFVGVNLDLSLSRLNAKKITIVGAVSTPGTYLVNPFTTISNSLAYAGGVRDFASLRSIKVLKPGGESFSFDLYQFLVFGNRANDLILEAGDTVLVEGTSKFIEITGEVLRPGIYEYLGVKA